MSFGFGFGFTKTTAAIRAAFSPSSLFATNEPGVWYDPSDLTTLYQDAAGTTPVTAMEQPVGRILDKSGRGNHATQTTSTSRPVLSARYNLLTKTERFDDAVWTKANVTVTANTEIAPDGTTTADTVTHASATGEIFQNNSIVASTCTFSFYAKYSNVQWIRPVVGSASDNVSVWFDIQNGVKGGTFNAGTAAHISSSITNVGSGWYLCVITASITSASGNYVQLNTASANDSHARAAGSFIVWGADLRVANAGVGLPAYQRVNTATDYDMAGFPHYLRFDGVDDFLVTNSINFTATDKMTVFAGVRKLSDAARGMLFEFSADVGANSGAFNVNAPATDLVSEKYTFASKGSAVSAASSGSVYASPITNILTGIGDISGDRATLRVNGSQVAQSTADQGTGTYSNYQMYIGRRGGTTLPFNGHLYGLIARGAQSTDQQIIDAERYINEKTRAY